MDLFLFFCFSLYLFILRLENSVFLLLYLYSIHFFRFRPLGVFIYAFGAKNEKISAKSPRFLFCLSLTFAEGLAFGQNREWKKRNGLNGSVPLFSFLF